MDEEGDGDDRKGEGRKIESVSSNPTGGSVWIVQSRPAENWKDSRNSTGSRRWNSQTLDLRRYLKETMRQGFPPTRPLFFLPLLLVPLSPCPHSPDRLLDLPPNRSICYRMESGIFLEEVMRSS